jgi:hypothetical protein
MRQLFAIIAALLIGIYIARRNPPPVVVQIPSILVPTPKPIAKPPEIRRVAFRTLLRPTYEALMKAAEPGVDLASDGPEVVRQREKFTGLPQSPERDAALRLCALIQRGVILTRTEGGRYRHVPEPSDPPSRGDTAAERAEMSAAEKATFFRGAIETRWREELLPLQKAAETEWLGIPESAEIEELK